MHVVGNAGEQAEVFAWQISHEVGVQDGSLRAAVVIDSEGIGCDIGVIDYSGSSVFDYFYSSIESIHNRAVWFLGRINEISWDANACATKARKIASSYVVRRFIERLGQSVVVFWVFASN